MIFPDAFPDSLLVEFDTTRSSVDWYTFVKALVAFYDKHFITGTDVPVQKTSVFQECNRRKLLYQESRFDQHTILPVQETPHFNFDNFRTPPRKDSEDSHLFSPPKWVRRWDDQNLYRMLKFFIPAFTWAYNELKDALLIDKAVMEQSKALIAAQDRIIIGEPASQVELDLEQFAPQKDRLSEGTAVPVRLLDAWKTKLQSLKPDWERASAGSAVGNLTGVAQIVVSAPPSAEPSPSPISPPQSVAAPPAQAKGEQKRSYYVDRFKNRTQQKGAEFLGKVS